MPVTTSMIDGDSPFALGTAKDASSRTYTQSMFDRALARAEERFARENPGLGSNEGDQAVEYLVCHFLYMTFEGAEDMVSGRIGDMSFQKKVDDETGEVMTTYLSLYKGLITLKGSRAVVAQAGVVAADAMTSRSLHPSNQRLPLMDYDDNSTGAPTPSNKRPAGQGPNPLYP